MIKQLERAQRVPLLPNGVLHLANVPTQTVAASLCILCPVVQG